MLTENHLGPEFDRKAWGKYLQNEWKYDKWGALGRILVIEEILLEEGVDLGRKPASGAEYQRLANEVFPRTFYCERDRVVSRLLVDAMLKYYNRLEKELTELGIDEAVVRSTALEETAEKFCLPFKRAKEIIKCP